MDRKTTFIGLGLIAIGIVSIGYMLLHNRSWNLRDSSPQKKVIIMNDGIIARYVSEDETNYFGEIQDDIVVSKDEARVETWYACDGKGIVHLGEEGEMPAYSEPDSTSRIVGKLTFVYGDCPDTYQCLGYGDGWFKIRIGDADGYINEKYVYWDSIDSM